MRFFTSWRSWRLYGVLMLIFALAVAGFLYFFPQEVSVYGDGEIESYSLLGSLTMGLSFGAFIGGIGLLGAFFMRKLDFVDLLDKRVGNDKRVVLPIKMGVVIGVGFILMDLVFSRFHSLGPLPHPGFPASVFASVTAAISEEVMFRLFLVGFFTLILRTVFKRVPMRIAFFMVACLSAFLFAVGHMPAVFILYGIKEFNEIPALVLLEIFILNGVLSFYAVYYLRYYGFLAPVLLHFTVDVVWHVLYGLIA